jgi:hypothetical protein
LFGSDPSYLRHIPLSEYRKRRDYWRLVRAKETGAQSGPGGVIVEHTGVQLEEDAKIVE